MCQEKPFGTGGMNKRPSYESEEVKKGVVSFLRPVFNLFIINPRWDARPSGLYGVGKIWF